MPSGPDTQLTHPALAQTPSSDRKARFFCRLGSIAPLFPYRHFHTAGVPKNLPNEAQCV